MRVAMYRVALRHDSGIMRIETCASSAAQAGKIVCDYERAPASAIVRITQVQVIYTSQESE